MSWAGTALASFLGAVLSALGMGGGGILLIYLTAYRGMLQQAAQGVNLVFFIPVALVALCIHAKHKLIRWRVVPLCMLLGLAGVWLGSKAALAMEPRLLGKLFGAFLLVIGVRELLTKDKNAGDGPSAKAELPPRK